MRTVYIYILGHINCRHVYIYTVWVQMCVCMIVFECVVGGCVCLCVFVFVLTCMNSPPPHTAPHTPTHPCPIDTHSYVLFVTLHISVPSWHSLFLLNVLVYSNHFHIVNILKTCFFKTTHLVLLIDFLYLWCMVSTTVDILYVTLDDKTSHKGQFEGNWDLYIIWKLNK